MSYQTMKKAVLVVIAMGLSSCKSLIKPEPEANTATQVNRFGVYLVVNEVERSAQFYEQVFQVAPEIKMSALIGFNIRGGFLALISKKVYAPQVRFGDGAVPYIQVNQVEKMHAHIKAIAASGVQISEVQVEGAFRFFKMKDPDGNTLEFFSITNK